MSFDALLDETCSILAKTATGYDDRNHPTYDWPVAEVVACRKERNTGDSGMTITTSRGAEVADFTLFMREPTTLTLSADDHRVLYDGVTFYILRVDQENHFHGKHHLEVDLRATASRA